MPLRRDDGSPRLNFFSSVALSLVILSGCASSRPVTRIVDGRTVVGRYIAPEAYAAYLRGVIEEESGHCDKALVAYQEAARFDGDDPEIQQRIARMRAAYSCAASK